MRTNQWLKIAVFVVLIALSTTAAVAWPHRRPKKAQVRFLATSTEIRTTWGFNQDIYLAEILLPRINERVLVRLVDEYPNESAPLSRAALRSESGTLLAVKRDAECDLPFGEMPLRTAPGDAMAIVAMPLRYEPTFEQTPSPESIVPCYRVLRR